MRLVIVGPAYPMRGGIAQSGALLYQALRKAGHDVHSLSFKRQYPAWLFPGKTQMDTGRDLIPISSHAILDSLNPLTWIQAVLWLKSIRPEALIFKYWMPFFSPCYAVVAGLAKWWMNLRIVTVCDNIIPHERRVGDIVLTKLGLRFADGYIVLSRSVRDELLSIRKQARYRQVPHPVYRIFPPSLKKKDARKCLSIREKSVILYFGLIRAYKGLRTLILALPEISKDRDVRCLICGEFYEGQAETLQLIHDLGLDDIVSVYDRFIPNEEVNVYFSAADLVVLPYVTATQSGVVQVAFHYDRPVLVTDVGGLPEQVVHGRTGYVVPPQSPDAISETVQRFFHRDMNEIPFESHIRAEKKQQSWEHMAEAVVEMIHPDKAAMT
ncbi:glycosyltransferase [bacterium]|nr:glycosyltransferase [bacterium]